MVWVDQETELEEMSISKWQTTETETKLEQAEPITSQTASGFGNNDNKLSGEAHSQHGLTREKNNENPGALFSIFVLQSHDAKLYRIVFGVDSQCVAVDFRKWVKRNRNKTTLWLLRKWS